MAQNDKYKHAEPCVRFWRYVNKQQNGCWEWTGYKNPAGYGEISITRSTHKSAHRFAYELYHQCQLSKADTIMHKCDNPKCVHPNHLIKGTQKDNIRDCINKVRWIQIPPKFMGSQHPNSILSESMVVQILDLYYKKRISRYKISKLFSVGYGTIKDIFKGRTWTHISMTYNKNGR